MRLARSHNLCKMASTYAAAPSMATRNILCFAIACVVNLLKTAEGDVPDMVAYTGKMFSVTFKSHPVFGNPAVNLELSVASNSPSSRLPSWLVYNSTSRSLSGVPLLKDQGWNLLTITSTCDHIQHHDSDECLKYSDVFRLSVIKFSWQDFMSRSFKPAKSVLDSLTESSYFADGYGTTESVSEDSACENHRVVASLLLCASLEELNSRLRIDLVNHLSDFLSIPVGSITVVPSSTRGLTAMENGLQMVSAGPGLDENCQLLQHTEVLWELPCSAVKHLTDFMRVLQHNVEGGRLREETKAQILGWYVASSDSLLTRQSRRRRGAPFRTVIPTPALTSITPTAVLVTPSTESSTHSLPLSPDAVPASSSVVIEPLSRILTSLSSSPSTTVASSAASFKQPSVFVSQSLLSASIEPSLILSPSPAVSAPVTEPLSTETELLSETSSITTYYHSHLSTKVASVAQPFNESSTLKLPTAELASSFSATHSESVISLQHHVSETEVLESITQLPSVDFHTIPETSSLPLVVENITTMDLGSLLQMSMQSTSSILESLSLFSLQPFDSVSLVTSRTMEVIAVSISATEFSFISGTESSLHSMLPLFDSGTEDSTSPTYIHETSPMIEYSSTEVPQIDSTFESQSAEQIPVLTNFSSPEYTSLPSSATVSATGVDLPVVLSLLSVSYAPPADVVVSADMSVSSSRDDLKTDKIHTDSVSDTIFKDESTVEIESVTETEQSLSLEIMSTYTSVLDIIQTSVVAASSGVTSATFIVPTVNMTLLTTESTSVASTVTLYTEISTDSGADLTTAATTALQQTTLGRPSTCAEVTWPQRDNTESENERPVLLQPLGLIFAEQGRLLEFDISQNVFCDREDGDTENLTLSIQFPSGQKLLSNLWLYLDVENQILKGIPLQEDMDVRNISIILTAQDSQGLTVNDTVTLYINDSPQSSITHVFIMKFAVEFHQFMQGRRNITNLLVKIAEHFGDYEVKFITVINISEGSFVLSWTNNTLNGAVCQMDMIKKLFNQMVGRDGIVRTSFYRGVGKDFQLLSVLFEPRGACYVPPATTMITTTTLLMSDPRGYSLSMWAHVILPVLIAILVFILIILIIVFCNRRRRQRQAILNAEKEAVSNDRNPIIFPDELENDDPSLRARDPLVLPADSHPSHPNLSPKSPQSRGSSRERARRNQERRKPESLGGDNLVPEHDRDRSRDYKHSKDRKKQKDDNRMSAVSASSTLSWDRPNNHYLEEEADSRSSTLRSTKSSSPEKRHPGSPPPYWHSQSDPPPYRLPPSYLTTNNTTQV